ncbi:MAG: alpha-E domain-containing protein [Streptosporangiaceae bacterium]
MTADAAVPTARTGLLSRIAATLFWTGRYIERADDTARMLDVYVHRMLEDSGADEDPGCRALLAVLGLPPPPGDHLDVAAVLALLAYDTRNPSSIAGSVLAARAGAHSVREVISSEMWVCLNVTGLQLADQAAVAERLGPHGYLGYVRERAALFFGLADSTMSRDDAWRFLVLGRSLERADMTARLLQARMPTTPYDLGPSLVLRACGGHESFLRSRSWTGSARPAAEFLLLDRIFPRSVLHALATAEECLAALEPGPVRTGIGDAARRPIGQMRTRLEYAEPQLPPAQLADLLAALQQACRQATEAITARYFRYGQPVAWEQDG